MGLKQTPDLALRTKASDMWRQKPLNPHPHPPNGVEERGGGGNVIPIQGMSATHKGWPHNTATKSHLTDFFLSRRQGVPMRARAFCM